MAIVHLNNLDYPAKAKVAVLLHETYRDFWPQAFPDINDAINEIGRLCTGDTVARVTVIGDENKPVGLVGATRLPGGTLWKVYPLFIEKPQQKKGFGKALLYDLEHQVRARNGKILWAEIPDIKHQTSLGDGDLFPDVMMRARRMRTREGMSHPFEIFRHVGYEIAGAMPDAYGFLKPCVLMARKL